jgi:hypothetical protein
MKDFMEVINYRITEGADYQWHCYGPDAYMLDSWNGAADGYTVSIVFDKETQVVYEMTAFDYFKDRAYRWVNPIFSDARKSEAKQRHVDDSQAWDEVEFTELEVKEDMLEKARAIVKGEEYDTRVQVPLSLEDSQMFELMKQAHYHDMTLNDYVEQILKTAVNRLEQGEEL